jgi:DNA-binding SARP family transcriptional activator
MERLTALNGVADTYGDAGQNPSRPERRESAGASALFEQFPYGIVLLRPKGTVLEINAAAKTLLGLWDEELGSGELTCCELFGCRAPGGPLEQHCLTKMASEAKGPLAEIRIDLPPGSGAGAVWLTPALLRSGGSRVLIHLRPADRRDRRRRNVALWPSASELEIFTLGRTTVRGPEGSLGRPWLRQRAGVLLKYLVCERRRTISADEIAEILWPRRDQQAVGNVRHFVHTLRERLEPERAKRAPSRFIVAEAGGYRLNTDAVRIDADDFQDGVRAGLRRLKYDDREAGEHLLMEAMQLYGGDFLADERYAWWAFSERDRLQELAGAALAALAGLRREADDADGAAAHLERLAEMYPLDPDAQRQVIAVALEQGRHTLAQRRYAAFRRRLLNEFGQEPPYGLADLAASALETSRPASDSRRWEA